MTVVLPVTGTSPLQVTFSEACNKHLFLPTDSKVTEVKKLSPSDKAWLRERFRVEYGYVFVNSDGNVISD